MNNAQIELYTMLSDMCKNYPNNMELGAKVRSLVYSIEENRKKALIELSRLGQELDAEDPNQMNIFDLIKG